MHIGKLPLDQREKIIVAMLTTSINPEDEKRVKDFPEVKAFFNKPLTVQLIRKLIERNFNEGQLIL